MSDFLYTQFAALVASLERYGESGWSWIWMSHETRTNAHGDGCFWRGADGTWSQSAGTSQYSLPPNRSRALRALRIRYGRRIFDPYHIVYQTDAKLLRDLAWLWHME